MRVALVCMPMFSVERGCIQIGLLKAVCEQSGRSTSDIYLNLSFAEQVGFDFYKKASYATEILLGEWLFGRDAFALDNGEEYLAQTQLLLRRSFEVTSDEEWVTLKNKLIEARQFVSLWIAREISIRDWASFDAIGFSCTFSQVVPSLALSKAIKSLAPNVKIIFGGSSLDSSMGEEVALRCPEIDCVVQGEGEKALGEVLDIIEAKKELPRLYSSEKSIDLNENPFPNYDTYYAGLEKLAANGDQFGALSFEASRGCWWGAKHHCTFCGLNADQMAYRLKRPERVLEEIDYLSQRHKQYRFQAVDNILSNTYFQTLLPQLSQNGTSFEFFFEIKSNLTFERMQLLKSAGLKYLQPGIESLDSDILALMKKGVSATQNIEALKFGRYFEIDLAWNLLYGFPGEKTASFEKMIALIPKLYHLQPPGGSNPIRLDRFSPYYKEYEAARKVADVDYTKGFSHIRPTIQYEICFPKTWNLKRIAYFFEGKADTEVPFATYVEFDRAVEAWRQKWKLAEVPRLVMKKGLTFAHIIDSRSEAESIFEIRGAYLAVAKALETKAQTKIQLQAVTGLEPEILEEILDMFIANSFVVIPDQSYVWLPISEKI